VANARRTSTFPPLRTAEFARAVLFVLNLCGRDVGQEGFHADNWLLVTFLVRSLF